MGITPVSTAWDFIKLIPSPYDKHDTFVYFDRNIICKRITLGENSYMEYDLNEETTNGRTELLPKTERGKIVKLTASTLEKRTPKGMFFSYNDGYIYIGKRETNRTFYDSYSEDIKLKNFEALSCWIEQWKSDTKTSDLNELAEFSSLPKKHCKYRVGDFFRLKLNRRLYGYGRILLDYDKMRKEKIKFWDILMGKPLVVKVYHIIDNELDFPVMYGKSIDATDSNKILLQSGQKYFEKTNRNRALYSEFRNNGVGFGIYVKLPILKRCIELHSNQPYWDQNNYMTNKDLRNPNFFAERQAVCKQFGVSEEDIFQKK